MTLYTSTVMRRGGKTTSKKKIKRSVSSTKNKKKRRDQKRAPRRAKRAKRIPVIVAPAMNTSALPSAVQLEPPTASRARHSHHTSPHRWSLRHNFTIITALTAVGLSAMVAVAGQADATFRMIEAYGQPATSLLFPVPTTTLAFQTKAGSLIVKFPQRWSVVNATEEHIQWQLTEQNEQALPELTLHIYQNESDNVFTWLEAHQPTYRNANVITPSEAVERWYGLLVSAAREDGAIIRVAYLPYQKSTGEKYIIEAMLVTESGMKDTQRIILDFYTVLNNFTVQ